MKTLSSSGPVYEFGQFALDTSAQRLSRSGEVVPLTPRVFDTLRYLVENPGRVLEKDELLAAIWPGVSVEENNLGQAISRIRAALGESPGDNRYIVTVPGRGYRFVGDVRAGRRPTRRRRPGQRRRRPHPAPGERFSWRER
jgi:DNA-binding winged helix-turn-helix (wHTH) protein